MKRTIVAAIIVVPFFAPVAALAQTEWLGKVADWFFGNDDADRSRCMIKWQTDAREVTFFFDDTDEFKLYLRRPSWNIPAGTSTKLKIDTLDFTTTYKNEKTLQVGPETGPYNSVDIILRTLTSNPVQIRFSGNEEPWTIPRIDWKAYVQAKIWCRQKWKEFHDKQSETQPF